MTLRFYKMLLNSKKQQESTGFYQLFAINLTYYIIIDI